MLITIEPNGISTGVEETVMMDRDDTKQIYERLEGGTSDDLLRD
jgi:hypothetical protein